MMKLSRGKLRLEDRIVDLSAFEVRPKVTEQDLENYYDSFIEHVEEVGDYFEDRNAFDTAVKDASNEKRPKLIAREPKFPFMWVYRNSFMPFNFLKPSERRLHDEYFMGAHCVINIPRKNGEETKEGEKPLDMRLREDIAKKFEQYPGFEAIIKIPNDTNPSETKSSTFHEGLHYVIARYQTETGRNLVNVFVNEELSQLEEYQTEHMINEHIVEILTDKLLIHDPSAQFENRWTGYSLNHDGFKTAVYLPSTLAAAVILGTSIVNAPYLIPLALVPGLIRDFVLERHKQSKREEILKPIEYPEFKFKI